MLEGIQAPSVLTSSLSFSLQRLLRRVSRSFMKLADGNSKECKCRKFCPFLKPRKKSNLKEEQRVQNFYILITTIIGYFKLALKPFDK